MLTSLTSRAAAPNRRAGVRARDFDGIAAKPALDSMQISVKRDSRVEPDSVPDGAAGHRRVRTVHDDAAAAGQVCGDGDGERLAAQIRHARRARRRGCALRFLEGTDLGGLVVTFFDRPGQLSGTRTERARGRRDVADSGSDSR